MKDGRVRTGNFREQLYESQGGRIRCEKLDNAVKV